MRFLRLCLATLLVGSATAAAHADTLTYTLTTTTSGVLDGNSFTDQAMTVSATFDAAVTNHAELFVTVANVTDSLGMGSFFAYSGGAGMGVPGQYFPTLDVLDVYASNNDLGQLVAGYTYTGAARGNTYYKFATTNGTLSYFDLSNPATLVVSAGPATVAATPEPSSLLLLGSGVLGVAGTLRRRVLT